MVAESKGFSLIELMIVVAIVGLLAVVTSPLTGGWVDSAEVRTAMSQFQQGVDRAKSISLSNPGGVIGSNASSILCLDHNVLKLIPAADPDTPASCSGVAMWQQVIASRVLAQANAADFVCIAFDNLGRTLNPAASGGADNCPATTTVDLQRGNAHVTRTYL